jgi:hypothetical protein
VWLSDGGGVAVSTPSVATKTLVRPEVFVNDTLIVAFCGYLTNLEELTTKMLYKELCEVGYLPERNLNARVVGMLYAKTHDPSQVRHEPTTLTCSTFSLRKSFPFYVGSVKCGKQRHSRDAGGDGARDAGLSLNRTKLALKISHSGCLPSRTTMPSALKCDNSEPSFDFCSFQ